MARNQNCPTETSPLLPKDVEASRVDIPDSTASTRVAVAQGTDHAVTEGEDGRDSRLKQYEGMPELRKQMPYLFPALCVGVFLAAADQTIIVSSYGRIGSDLHALNKTSWIATAYFLTLTSFQPLYGKLSDIFSRKSCLLVAYIIFGLGCLFCGLAQDINQLVAARALAGVGGGGMTVVVSILLSDAIPLKDRGTWQGYINIVYAAGAGIGAPMGGFLADGIGWRWAFIIQAPLCLVAFFAVAIILKTPVKDTTNLGEKLKRVDFLGAAVLIVTVFSLLFGLDRGSNVSWSQTITLVPLCLSLPLFAAFILVEVKVATEPFAPGRIVFERSLFACYLCNFFSFAGYLATLFYVPLYLQAVDGYSATQAGLLLIPGILSGVSGSLFAGFYMKRTGKYAWLTTICYAHLVIGVALVLLFAGLVTDSALGISLSLIVSSFSNGIGVTSSLIALISNAAREDQAVVTACSYLFRSLGSTTGVALSATVANQVLRARLTKELGSGKEAANIERNVRRSLAYIKTLEPEVRDIVKHCYALCARWAFALQVALVAGAAISAWFIREKPLSKK